MIGMEMLVRVCFSCTTVFFTCTHPSPLGVADPVPYEFSDEDLFFSDTSAMTSWPIPTTQYTTSISSHTHALGISDPDLLQLEEPPYDPTADYSQPNTKQCFNCMSTNHIVSECPYKRNSQHIALARAEYGSRSGNVGRYVRLHVAAEEMQRKTEFARAFEPGYVKGEVLRESLGLSAMYGGGNEDLPWYDAMCEWGYPPGWVSFVGE
jgi:hypothetical protein